MPGAFSMTGMHGQSIPQQSELSLAKSRKTREKASSVNRRWSATVLNRLFVLLGREPGKPDAVRASAVEAPAKRRRAARPRDFQRQRVYAWEAAVLNPTRGGKLSLGACERLIEEVFRWHDQPSAADLSWRPPHLGDGRGRRHACGSRDVIKLPRWARTRTIVLHECAHGMSADGHGPQFVRAYTTLLCRFQAHDRANLEASLRIHKIRIAPHVRRED
jgi:hypothetical protein